MSNDMEKVSWPGWETQRLIGRGSFGAVYEIQRNIFDATEKAALKVITIPQNNGDIEELYNDGYDEESITSTFQSHLQSIVAEYSMMRKMNGCANIVNCDDVRYVQHNDGIGWDIFIKMELLTPLTKALPTVASEETVIKVARDMCTALELCKQFGIIHRDIKPQNIFVSPHGDYKLGDFGIAKTVEKTMGGTKIGTYKYMAPEVYHNKPYGTAADIYSLGLVLYWMLNERRMPFLPLPPAKMTSGMDEQARYRRLSGEQLSAPAHGSEGLKKIVLKACAFEQKNRYHSAAAMLEDLDRLTNGLSVADVVKEEDDATSAGDITTAGTTAPTAFVPIPAQSRTPSDGGILKDEERTVPNPLEDTSTQPEVEERFKKKPVLIGLIAGLAAVLLIVILLLRGCGTGDSAPGSTDGNQGTGSSSPVAETEEVFEMALNTDRLSVFEDATAILEVSGIPEDAKVKWSSSDKSVAKVNSDGEVTGVGEGIATITVTWKHDGETYTASAEVTVVASGITLSEYTIDSFYVGETRTLTATTSPEGEKVDWKSSDVSVATVSADGVVTAMGGGTVTITACYGNYTETCNVTVTIPYVSLSKTSASLYIGDSTTIHASALPTSASVSWSSDNNGVASVSSGTIHAAGSGSTKIRAKISHAGKTYEATCSVNVVTPSVVLSTSSVSILPGESKNLTASTKPEGKNVSWSSSNTGVVTVSGGKVTAVAPGTATITAQFTYADKTYKATCSVTVAEPTIVVTSSASTIAYAERDSDRQTCTLTAEVNPDGGSVTWSSSNSSVATVSGNGTTATVKAMSEGSATITATYTIKGKTVSDQCTITVQKAASTLSIANFAYAQSGTCDTFWVTGTITSNYALKRVECVGTAKSNALGISVGGDPAEPYYFGDGVYSFDVSNLTSYFINQYRSLYNLYATVAGVLGADQSVTMNITVTCYDASGYCESRTLTYVIYDG